MRRGPIDDPPPLAVALDAEVIAERRVYRFLTYVFGGGVAPQQCDPITPVRAASIRGQLRFWWRAVNPSKCRTVDDLRKREAEVFGSTSVRSRLVVAVTRQPEAPKPVEVLEGDFKAKPGCEAVAYGAFPLRAKGGPHGRLHDFADGTFEVSLRYPAAVADDVRAALWGWAHFGGLGARTRRGFGALAQESPGLPDIDTGWTEFVDEAAVPWPHLVTKPRHFESAGGTGRGALDTLLEAMRSIRQLPNVGRNPGQERRPGRSRWPEPDAIRGLFRQFSRQHATPITQIDVFPRARFGAPIIFHFKDNKTGDPNDTTLLPLLRHGQPGERLASPLVLRPYCRPDGVVEAMAVVLGHPAPHGWCVKQGTRVEPVTTTLTTPFQVGTGAPFIDPIDRFFEQMTRTSKR